MADYEFRYSPLTGRLTGKQMIEQTEQAINQLSALVDSAAGQVEIISTLANEANENAATALETAEEALATTGRTYITVSTQTDANNYYDSQLIYIADSTSTNIPVADTGMLEVKTNDNKTACEQVFIAASSGDAYYRHGAITAETVGDVTTYTVTWSGWSSQPASQTYVQQELTNYLPLSGGTLTGVVNGVTPTAGDDSKKLATTEFVNAKAGNYLPLSGGTLTGVVDGVTPTAGDDSKKLATTEFVNAKAGNYLPLSGGTMTGTVITTANPALKTNGTNSYIVLCGAEKYTKGAHLILSGKDRTDNEGRFGIVANDGTNTQMLVGRPDGTLTWNNQPLLPVGIVQAFAGTTIPTGWLLCDGSAVSRTTYASLYACIGTTYGAGNGSTTFNLPNLVDKFVEGSATAGTVKSAGLPNITGDVSMLRGGSNVSLITTDWGTGAIRLNPVDWTGTHTAWAEGAGNPTKASTLSINASRSSSIYGNSNTVQPPALTMRYIIKY